MAIKDSIMTKAVTLSPDQTVDEALTLFEKKKIRSAPVVESDGRLVGYFSLRHLMKALLPISVTVGEGVNVPLGMAPGLDKRLVTLKPQSVSTLMERDITTVTPDQKRWEVIKHLTENPRPLPVVDEQGKFLGLVTEMSALENLENVED